MKGNTWFLMMYILSGIIDLYITIKYMEFFLGKIKVSGKTAKYTYICCYLLCTFQYIKLPIPLFNMIVSYITLYMIARCYESKKNRIWVAVFLVFMFQFVCELIVAFITGGGNLNIPETDILLRHISLSV